MTKMNYEILEIDIDPKRISMRFDAEMSIRELPDLLYQGEKYSPYMGNRFSSHPFPGYYVEYIPQTDRSMQALGRMGGPAKVEPLRIETGEDNVCQSDTEIHRVSL